MTIEPQVGLLMLVWRVIRFEGLLGGEYSTLPFFCLICFSLDSSMYL